MSDLPVDKTLEEIRTEMYDQIGEVQEEYAAKGWLPRLMNLNKGVIRGMIELWCWGLRQLYSFLAAVLKQAFPSTATGAWLDLHCKQVGLTRLAATKASGTVYFTRTDSSGNVLIVAGRVMRTLPDGAGEIYRFVTTDDVVLLDGLTEVAAAVEAEAYGAGANVTVGQICEIVTTISGVDGVENRDGWLESEGADEETDDALRERYVLAWMEVNGCTKYAYEAWARSVTGVVAATILDQHPRGQGTVDVVIKGTAGLPTQALIDAVDAVVQAKVPVNDDAEVKAPDAVDVAIEATLVLASGTESEILAEATSRLQALFTDPSPVDGITALQVGEDLPVDRLVATVMAVDGVKQITWTSPAADVQVDEDELAVLSGDITLDAEWATEV